MLVADLAYDIMQPCSQLMRASSPTTVQMPWPAPMEPAGLAIGFELDEEIPTMPSPASHFPRK